MQTKTELLAKISDKEDRMLLSSVYDKLEQSYQKNYPIYTDFLDERQITMVKAFFPFFQEQLSFYGGIQNAGRNICYLRFGYEQFPVVLLKLSFPKGADISHRDVLGALMGLGIKRQKIGDILIGESNVVAVKEEILKYILENLTSVGRYPVSVSVLENETVIMEEKVSFRTTTVAALRLDCIVSDITRLSREKSKELILSGKVKLNHFEETNYKKVLSQGDLVSISKKGRFALSEIEGITRKDRIKITIKKYE
ncbi:MAG: hypothetical protein IKW04_01070 [Clostridia bacterium]|nr:hypothetical protein [Clostridia bacterium]